MRSDLMKKGIEKAPQRSLLKAMGYTDSEIERPIIGIANSSNEIVPGHIHLDEIAKSVKAEVRSAGGLPVEFSTIAVCDGLAMGHLGMKYSLCSRELIADSIEIMAMAHPFDGLVLIPNCDKVVPGMLMAALRLNIPAILVSGGPMLAGYFQGKALDLISVFEAVGSFTSGKMTEEKLRLLEENACPGYGSCSGMFSANSMNCLSEALGLALPGNGTIPAVMAERKRLAKYAGTRIMELYQKNIRPRDIAILAAFKNAIRVEMALGASTNTVLHLPAIAKEAKVVLDLELFNQLSKSTPNLCRLSPAGAFHLEDLHRAGGVAAVMSELARQELLNLKVMTVTGKSMGENISNCKVLDNEVIRPIEKPYSAEGGLAILKGNLAPEGAVVKQSAVAPEMLSHIGAARVFESEEEAMAAIMKKKIRKGEVLVIRYEGPKGGPGMREMLSPTSTIVGIGLDKEVALITDGRFSGGTRGAAIGHISPEAAEGGPIAIVRNGDLIEIDIPKRELNLKLTPEEIKKRLSLWKAPEPKIKEGYLYHYSKQVLSASSGAVLKE